MEAWTKTLEAWTCYETTHFDFTCSARALHGLTRVPISVSMSLSVSVSASVYVSSKDCFNDCFND